VLGLVGHHAVNPATALATVLVDELVRCGVREAVLCPGSRSAPLAYALQEADRTGRLRLHVRVDERSAGFLALGLAKGGSGVVPVVTTSGTAVANLHPAVMEANHGRVPLLVITADRPPELRGTGANQTTDQVGIFGSAVRWSHDLGTPERRAGQNAVWRSVAARAWAAGVGGMNEFAPGPVHLNVPLREPLVPEPSDNEAESSWPELLEGRPDGRAWVTYRVPPGRNSHFTSGARTLVVVGDLPQAWMASEAAQVAAGVGWPVVREPFGQDFADEDVSTVVPRGPLLLTATEWLDAHAPEHVVVVGRATLSRAVAAVLRRPEVEVHVVTTRGQWPDPSGLAAHVWSWGHFHQLDEELQSRDPAWLADWTEAGRRVDTAAERVLAGEDVWPSGLAVADSLLTALPEDAVLFTGSSNPVRDLDLTRSPRHGARIAVLANRGLAGIDGCVSTAVGIALAEQDGQIDAETPGSDRVPAATAHARGGRPAYALMGDLTFLHDTNGLLIGPHEPRPDLTIVVTNDDGGGIFTTLEPGEPSRAGDFERIFGTPTGTSVADLCRAHGVGHVLAKTRDELADAVKQRPRGLRVVEVPVPRDGHRGLHARLRAAAAEALRDR
jgi:2-succinyl-5-enolpyruvyl-6-hydroxy-3-cyclohexene-1-carboxylate synthase